MISTGLSSAIAPSHLRTFASSHLRTAEELPTHAAHGPRPADQLTDQPTDRPTSHLRLFASSHLRTFFCIITTTLQLCASRSTLWNSIFVGNLFKLISAFLCRHPSRALRGAPLSTCWTTHFEVALLPRAEAIEMMPGYIFGFMTFIAAYHYIRTFNSWADDACSLLWPRDVHRSSTLHQDLQFSNR